MSREEPALFRRFPQARTAIPWLPLGDFPTPVHPLDGLQGAFSPATASVKRDDLSSALYGGNKVRSLEFLLADALARRAEVLMVAGGIGSHFVSASALFARQAGLRVEAVLWGQPWSARCAESLRLLAHLGVPVRYHPRPSLALAATLLACWQHRARGRRVFLMPPGGSSAHGVLGWVDAALELAEQVEAGEVGAPDSVWIPCGSGGSAAGLGLGFRLAGLPLRVRAVRVTPWVACNRVRLGWLAAGAGSLLRAGQEGNEGNEETEEMGGQSGGRGTGDGGRVRPQSSPSFSGGSGCTRVELAHEQYRPGYGVSSRAAEEGASLLRSCGLGADTTYTGRAVAALLEAAPREGGRHLFWHTLSAVGAPVPDEVALESLPQPLRRLLGA